MSSDVNLEAVMAADLVQQLDLMMAVVLVFAWVVSLVTMWVERKAGKLVVSKVASSADVKDALTAVLLVFLMAERMVVDLAIY